MKEVHKYWRTAKVDGIEFKVSMRASDSNFHYTVYDPQSNKWNDISPMIVPRCEFGLCALGGTLWAVGGWIGVDIGGSMECYDPIKNAWTDIGEF